MPKSTKGSSKATSKPSFAKASADAKAKADRSEGKSSKKPTSMEELLAATGYKIPSLRRGQEVNGKILSISGQEVLIDISAKSEGIVAGRELVSVKDLVSKLAVGDQIDAIVLYPENDAGQVVLSLRKISGEKRWIELEEKKTCAEPIEVVAVEVNRGGVICDWMGLRGFLPASQLIASSSGSSKISDLIGKNLNVRVIEVDRATNRLIFSQKQPDVKGFKDFSKLLSKVKIGEKYSGVITAVLPFGLFVEIEVDATKEPKGPKEPKVKTSGSSGSSVTSVPSKLEGLVHISEISWEKIDDPNNLFKVGDKVEVMVIAKDEAIGRLNLSLKQLAHDPFLEVSAKYTENQNVVGSVSKVTPYGVFVTLDEGVEGLVHISKIPPDQSWEAGQSIECTIESIDTTNRRISLVPIVREKPILYR